MKLGINAIGLYPGKVGGAEQYLRNIVLKLCDFNDIETHIFLNATAISTFTELDHCKLHCVDMHKPHDAQLNNFIKYYNLDIWFCPFFHLIPVECSIPSVTTIFDIQQDFYPENFDKRVLKDRKQLTKQTVEKTDMILTISEFSKKTLINKYNIAEEKIKVTYLDADSTFENDIDLDKLSEIKSSLPEEFIFYPANMWPHKNHIMLIKGFALALEKYNLPLKLVLTGARERETSRIENLIQNEGLREMIIYLGYIQQGDMPYVYKAANMLVFPSLFEGFGIPLVEAMESEIPIVCSDTSCIPEIVGEAAVYFNGQSSEAIAKAIHDVYCNEKLRSKLIDEGIERRKMFSWDLCAEKTIEHIFSVYKPQKSKVCRFSEHPLVSIITPSYNQGEFIRDTIESVLNQSYDNIEYIVMDGGSTDNTVEILKSYGDRIKWISEKDKGQADAVNKGIRAAQGEIIGWLNSDDTYYLETVEKIVKAFLSHPEESMIYGEGDYINREGVVTEPYPTQTFDYNLLANECFICQPTVFFTKEIVEKVGLLNANLQLCMDYELWMRIGKQGEVLYIPETLATSRMYEDNKTLSRRGEVYKECCREVKRYYGYVPHTWIYGYATYKHGMNSRISKKIYYAYLFFKYNYNRFDYFKQCFLKYIEIKTQNRILLESIPVTSEIQFSDGWLSNKYTTMLQNEKVVTQVVIKGKHLLPMNDKMKIKAEISGRYVGEFLLDTLGDFEVVFNIGQTIEPGVHKACLEMSETYNGVRAKKSNDNRELSILLEKIFLR